MKKIFFFILLLMIVFHFPRITHAEPIPIAGPSEEFIADFIAANGIVTQGEIDLVHKAFDNYKNAIPEAFNIWDSEWFMIFLGEILKRELGPTWYSQYNYAPWQFKHLQVVKDSVGYAKALIESAEIKIKTPDYCGIFALTYGGSGKNFIGLALNCLYSAKKLPFYSNQVVWLLMHESIHAFLFYAEWYDGWIDYDDGLYQPTSKQYIWKDIDHCITWGLMLGPSVGNLGTCNIISYDIEAALTEVTNTYDELPSLKQIIESAIDSDGDCKPVSADEDADGDGLSNEEENTSNPPTNPWIPDTDMDSSFSGNYFNDGKYDRFPIDPYERFDSDYDGMGDMSDPCPKVDNCDGDSAPDLTDGQPFNPYCQVDKDRDGLCGHLVVCPAGATSPACNVRLDPNDDSLDSDGDGMPDFIDVDPKDPNETGWIAVSYSFDIDGDHLCDTSTEDIDLKIEGKTVEACSAGPDPCPWKWDCDGDWLSDGGVIPKYIQQTIIQTSFDDSGSDGDGDGIPNKEDGQPYNPNCTIDKDKDGLCADIDPNDDPDKGGLDSDGDGIPDFADDAPSDANIKTLKEGTNDFDVDDDGLCDSSAENIKVGDKIECVGGPDPCPWIWDCNKDGVNDGLGMFPSYVVKNYEKWFNSLEAHGAMNCVPWPDPYPTIPTDLLVKTGCVDPACTRGKSLELKWGDCSIPKTPVSEGEESGQAKSLTEAAFNIKIPNNCDLTIENALLDTDGDGLLNCVDQDIDNDGLPDIFDPNPYKTNTDCDCQDDAIDPLPEDPYNPACSEDMSPKDKDGDGVSDDKDNCPSAYNFEQADSDGDGFGDICDTPEYEAQHCYCVGDCNMLVEPKEVFGTIVSACNLYTCCGIEAWDWKSPTWKNIDNCKGGCIHCEPITNDCGAFMDSGESVILPYGTHMEPDYSKQEKWFAKHPNCHKKTTLNTTESACPLNPDLKYKVQIVSCNIECCDNMVIPNFDEIDTDGDGLKNGEEKKLGTSYASVDTDGDLCTDSQEVLEYKTNPLIKDCGKYNSMKDTDNADDSNPPKGPDSDSDGIANLIDNCMDVANTEQFDSDFDGTGDACEETPQEGGSLPLFAEGEDSDGDGTPDGYDDAPSDPLVAHDMDGDGVDNENEEDDIDGDGVYDWDEAPTCAYCKYDPNESKDDDGDGIGNNLESKLFSLTTGKSLSQETSDSDGDGMPDGFDTDKDGLSDGNEILVYYDKKTGKVIYYQLFDPTMVDTDYNGLPDLIEYNNGCDADLFVDDFYGDIDIDGQANCYDSDADGDFISNKLELTGGPFAGIPTLQELFTTDPKSSDTDGDEVKDIIDNCPNIYNADQKDTDKIKLYGKYALGNACDPDDDDDGTLDEADCAPTIKWVAPTMPEYCGNKVDDNCNGQFDENCSGNYDGDDIVDLADDCPYIPSQKGDKKLCAEYPHFIPFYHTNIDDINNDGCMCAFCINNEDCNPGFKCINGKCQIGPDYVIYKELYHECCLLCNFDNDCEELKIWKAQYPEPAAEEPAQPPAEPEQPPQPDQEVGGDSAGDDKPMLPAGKGPVPPPSGRVVEPGVRPVVVQPPKEKPVEEKPSDRLPVQPPPALPIVDWDGDGVVPKDNCPCVPNPDQDTDSMLVKWCSSMAYCKNMADYTEAKIACIGEDCWEKPCAPGMRCSGGKCIPWTNYGWSYVASLYHGCCGEETSEVCKDGRIWIAQYQYGLGELCQYDYECKDGLKCLGGKCVTELMPESSDPNDIDGDGIPNDKDDDIDGDGRTNVFETNSFEVWKSDPYKYDTDGDGLGDKEDNCPNIFNSDQTNTGLQLCMAGKIDPILSKFKVPQEIGGEKVWVLVDEAAFCSQLGPNTWGINICENGKVSLSGWCKFRHKLGDACFENDDHDCVPDSYDSTPQIPDEDICGNKTDDNCDGQIDENCN